MKKIIIVYVISVVSLFILPIFFVEEYQANDSNNNVKELKIKLLSSEKNEIIEMDIEEYIMGVLIGEMPVDYNIEALKAQAIVARTYTLNKIINSPESHENADICDDINHCQAYKTKEYAFDCWDDKEENEKWNKIKSAVMDTKAKVIVYNGQLINAFFHANSGGKTEDICNIWGHEIIPYLKSVDGNEEKEYIENVTISYEEFEKIMRKEYIDYVNILENNQMKIDENIESKEEMMRNTVKIIEKNSSGRVSKFQISNIFIDGTKVRSLFGLRSAFFEISYTADSLIFKTKGYGHGVGMSQDGANAMASKGAKCDEIIKHYYTNVEIKEYKV